MRQRLTVGGGFDVRQQGCAGGDPIAFGTSQQRISTARRRDTATERVGQEGRPSRELVCDVWPTPPGALFNSGAMRRLENSRRQIRRNAWVVIGLFSMNWGA